MEYRRRTPFGRLTICAPRQSVGRFDATQQPSHRGLDGL